MQSMISVGKFYFFVTRTCILDLFHNGGLLIYSFILVIISISDLVSMCEYKRILTFKRDEKGLFTVDSR